MSSQSSLLKFHGDTLALLGVSPSISRRSISEMDAIESRIGRKLPAAVREWYSIDGACDLMLRYSNGDPPLEIREFGVPRVDTTGQGPHDLLMHDLVAFRYENQAVCVWVFGLDGSDDPPVYVDVDSQFRTWTRCSPTFSAHLYAWMWDWASVLQNDLLVQAQNQPLSESAVSFLRERLDVGPITYGWPGHTQYRFSSPGQRLLIWASDKQADWWLTAEDENSLRELINQIRHCDEVGNSLWSNSRRAEALL
jgi:hypothetical protein